VERGVKLPAGSSSEGNLPVDAQLDEVKNLLADIDADDAPTRQEKPSRGGANPDHVIGPAVRSPVRPVLLKSALMLRWLTHYVCWSVWFGWCAGEHPT
jgi:hypothetical protein